MNQCIVDIFAAPQPRLGARVLVVDDDPFIRSLHSILLHKSGFDVTTAVNGIEALERIADEPFDLLLTDCRMPGLDGASVIATLRAAGYEMPIVMVSASVTDTHFPSAIRDRVFAAIPKPASAMEVISAVREALRPTLQIEPEMALG
jgi:CheY-like chemotaxis protein